MILSFSEFNNLYESYNGYDNDVYSNGIDIMESLFTVMNKKGTLTESEVVTFLDNVLYETGWDLNTDVYESYAEWLSDWSQFIDEGVNEDESELLFALTTRGERLLEAGDGGPNMLQRGLSKIKDANMLGKGAMSQLKGDWNSGADKKTLLKNAGNTSLSRSGKGLKVKHAAGAAALAGGAALGYGAYKGIKALKARSAAKKAAAAGQPAHT